MDGQKLAKQTLDLIPQAQANAKRIVGLVKEGGRITGYQLSDNSIVEKQQAVSMAKQGQIAGVGIAHPKGTEYLKSIPDGSENNNRTNGSQCSFCPGKKPIPGETDFATVCSDLAKEWDPENATIVSVDVASPKMFPPESADLVDKISLRIDHHGSGTPFAPEELVDPTAAACAEMIYDILQLMGVTLTAEMAIPLYTGTATDTGCFRYANTDEHTFLVAACAATGAKLQPINQALFDTVSLNKLKVQAWVTTHTQFYCDGQHAAAGGRGDAETGRLCLRVPH